MNAHGRSCWRRPAALAGRIQGSDTRYLKVGQRVVISSHFVAQENIARPTQILIGIAAAGAVAERVQADWRDG
jgi:alcohol dehydrogenase